MVLQNLVVRPRPVRKDKTFTIGYYEVTYNKATVTY